MKATDDLFQLIKSMSRSEKGYFKKFAQKHTIGVKNIYVRLFDAIDRLETYSEEDLKNKFRGERFADKIYSTKNYLFNLILKSLSSYHAERFAISRMNNMLTELNVLFEKGLYKQFRTLLNKAIDIAVKNDKKFYLAHFYEREIRFFVTEYYEGSTADKFYPLKDKVLLNLDKIRLDEEYQLLYYELFYILKQMGSVRNKKDLETLNKFINNPLLQDEKLAGSFNAKFHLYSILGHYYKVTNDSGNWYKYRKKLLDLLESNNTYLKESMTSYISVLNNFLNSCVHTGRYKEFRVNFEKLRKLTKQFENKKEFFDLQTRLFLLTSDLELTYSVKKADADRMKVIIEKIESGFAEYGSKIIENRKIPLYNMVAYASFILQNFQKSIGYINKILNITQPGVEPEQHSFARIRNLIVHFESGNFDLLEHSIRSTKRFLIKTNRLYKYENLVLEFITKAINAPEEHELIRLYSNLRDELIKISEDKFEKNALEQFDVISWLESKINKKSFAETLKANAKKHKAGID